LSRAAGAGGASRSTGRFAPGISAAKGEMMDYRRLGRTDLRVSSLALGTMTFGEQTSEAAGHAQLDYALAQGINLIDTAEIYAIPPRPETQGASERVIGTWLKARGSRDKIVLATKVAGRSAATTWLEGREGGADLSRRQIRLAVEGSLKRLQTDYVDLYQTHWPDRPAAIFGRRARPGERRDHAAVPIEETLQALGDLVREGKVRHIGVSNETPWGAMAYLRAAERHSLARIQSIQNAYNLVNRTFEAGLEEVALEEGLSLLAYSPLAQGTLTGKYRGGGLPAHSRKALFNRLGRYEGPRATEAMEAYFALAERLRVSSTHLALRFCETRPFVISAILGAVTLDQLKENMAATELPWTQEMEKEVDALHRLQPNPCP
jgi:aryl-alcohol dehydrogenase-like predicted oxidoreductase